jgi:hypothetical protein
MEFIIGKRYKWNPYIHGQKLWKNGVLLKIYNKTYSSGKTVRIGLFVTRNNEEWEINLDDGNIELYK